MLSLLRETPIFSFIIILSLWSFGARGILLDRNGCGETKACFFKPAGCDPELDCTIGIIFFVSGPNKMTVQMVAQSLMPAPQLQYIALGFSKDSIMGDDFVTECVLSPESMAFSDSEVFASYNHGKANDRTRLNSSEHAMMYDKIEGEVVDGLLKCSFVQTLVPQFIHNRPERLWNLNHNYYVMGATGTAQPDEVNAHDTSIGSHFYPVISARAVNPSLIGEKIYPLPKPAVPTQPVIITHPIKVPPRKTVATQQPDKSSTENSGSKAENWPTLITFTSLLISFVVTMLVL